MDHYLAIAKREIEKGDAEERRAAAATERKAKHYHRAATEIVAAKQADPSLTNEAIGKAVGKSKVWVGLLIQSLDKVKPDSPDEFRVDWKRGSHATRAETQAATERAIREQPKEIAAAIAEAPPEAQREIADALVKSPTTERSLRSVATPRGERTPSPPDPERKLGDAVFSAWEAAELLMDAAPGPESRVRMAAMAARLASLGGGIERLLDTGELDDALRELLRETRAEA